MGVYVVGGMETESISEVLCLWNFTTKDFEEGVQTLDTGHYRYVTRSKKLFWGTVSFPSLPVHCTTSIWELKRHFSEVSGRAALKPLDMLDRR